MIPYTWDGPLHILIHVYISGHRLISHNMFIFSEDRFILANSVDHEEMPHYAGYSQFAKVRILEALVCICLTDDNHNERT